MIALATIHRADERTLVEHGCAFWQILANAHTRQFCWNRAKRTPNFGRHVGLHVPSVDVTRPAGHPQENDTLVAPNRLAVLHCFAADLKQTRQSQSSQTRQAGFQHAAPAQDSQTLTRAAVQKRKSMLATVGMRRFVKHEAK